MRVLILTVSFIALSCSNVKEVSKTPTPIIDLMNQSAEDWNEGNLDALLCCRMDRLESQV